MIDRIHWLGHASFRIEGPPLIYINPWRIARGAFLADIILVSSDDYDHCSPADVEKMRGPHTVVIANPSAAETLPGKVTVLRPWQSVNVDTARITAVPAYTFTGTHPVSKNELGFLISIDYYDIYYAGRTDDVPELGNIHADVAILPVAGGPGTLSPDRAADLVRRMKPGWVIPSHWGAVGGTHLDVHALARAVNGGAKFVFPEKVR